MSLLLAFADDRSARHAVLNWHYSKCMPMPPMVRIGVWEDSSFRGVVIFSKGNAPNLHRVFGVSSVEVVELSRIALRGHAAPVSRIVRVAIKLLKEKCPKLRLIVSFADPDQGHVGGIYKAGGWAYLGTSQSSQKWLCP